MTREFPLVVMVCNTQCSRALTTREFPLVVMVCNTQCSRALTTREFPLVNQMSSRTNHFTDVLAVGGANNQRSLGVRVALNWLACKKCNDSFCSVD